MDILTKEYLIEEYVKKIGDKEEDLISFKSKIDEILLLSKQKLKKVTSDLDLKFNSNSIREEEYLNLFRKEKDEILQRTKEELDVLIKNL